MIVLEIKVEKIKSLYIFDYFELFGNKKLLWSCENMINNKKIEESL